MSQGSQTFAPPLAHVTPQSAPMRAPWVAQPVARGDAYAAFTGASTLTARA